MTNHCMIAVAVLVAGGAFAAPVLKISPSSGFNFGKYPANQEKKHTFLLTNTGDELLKIDKIKITCGCSAADVDKKELEPGETANLTAQINRESIAGPFSKGIFIHSNASNGRIQVVTLNGESVPLVTVLPQDKIYAGTLKAGRPFRQEFILNASEPTVWAKPKITGDIQPVVALEKLSDRQTKMTISWTPEKEYSLFRCAVTLGIESPADWKPVEISLQGRVTDSNDNLQKGQ